MQTFLILATAATAIWFLWPERPRRQRRVLWRESDARARLELMDRWEPQERCKGAWDLVDGEVRRDW